MEDIKQNLFQETLYNLAYNCGQDNIIFELDIDSVELFETIKTWTREFETMYKEEDWSEIGYMETLNDFYQIKKHQLYFKNNP